MAIFNVKNIKWDVTDSGNEIDYKPNHPALKNLPKEAQVECDEEHEIADELSDKYGYCVFGYNLEKPTHEAAAVPTISSISEKLRGPEVKAGGYPAGKLRESLLIEGLKLIAEQSNVKIDPYYIRSDGDMDLKTVDGRPYSEQFTALLNEVGVRTGEQRFGYKAGLIANQSNWCYINHFTAEKLIHITAERSAVVEQTFDSPSI